MQRFYFERKLEKTEIFTDDKFHQISRVLRMQIGDEVILFHDDEEYIYEIKSFQKKSAELIRKKEVIRPNPENKKNITLYQALPNKLEKIEWIIEKNIELGVQKIVFFRSERSQKIFLSENKILRMYEIAREALEQCGGKYFPELVFSEKNLEFFVKNRNKDEIALYLHTSWENFSVSQIQNRSCFSFWIWPEGWWSDKECTIMNDNNFITVHFWNRIWRTETAGICMTSIILYS